MISRQRGHALQVISLHLPKSSAALVVVMNLDNLNQRIVFVRLVSSHPRRRRRRC